RCLLFGVRLGAVTGWNSWFLLPRIRRSVMTATSAWPQVGGIVYGGDYNPEQWPREVWDHDVVLMRQAGVTMVSIGVFSWGLVEPREGEFTWEWLDDVLDLLHANGIAANVGTPTASPPDWFFYAHPDARAVTRAGV